MTAEIVIMNKQGIAIAADSAMTISNGSNTYKVYNSANKLFSLSKTQPIGIMIYNDGSFMGTPWESLIKFYRSSHLKSQSFSTTKEYYNDFLDFLRTTNLLNQQDESEFYFLTIYNKFNKITKDAQIYIKSKPVPANTPLDRHINNVLKNLLKIFVNVTDQSLDRHAFSEQIEAKYLEEYRSTISEIFDSIFSNIGAADELKESVIRACVKLLGCHSTHICTYSGLVVAGFGTEDKYPSLFSCEIEYRFQGNIPLVNSEEIYISNELKSAIRPFAQRNMADLYINGIDTKVKNVIFESFKDALSSIAAEVTRSLSVTPTQAQKTEISNIIEQTYLSIQSQYNFHLTDNFIRPLLSSVTLLPLEEMVLMAKTLVHLTSFKQRVTHTLETVGGPIDIAVISKGDGFIWIDRKHYFTKEINGDFYERRYGSTK